MTTDTTHEILNTFSPDEAALMAQVEAYCDAAIWYVPRTDELRSAMSSDVGARAIVTAAEAAADAILFHQDYAGREVWHFIYLVRAAQISEAAHA